MKKFLLALAAASVISVSSAASAINIIPHPNEIIVSQGNFSVPSCLKVTAPVSGDESMGKEVVKYLNQVGMEAVSARKGADVRVKKDSSLSSEAYRLEVTPQGIEMAASGARGLFYAVQTLAQLCGQSAEGTIQACVVKDSPRMAYRGLMLDVVRCYIPPEEIKKFIDVAAKLKINNVHLHLTDDNGWRLQIKKYPKLTETGAWRVDRPELFPGRLNQRSASEPTPVGGFYTRKEMRDIVKYAAERHINIIPEIEMPAHAAAAIASYPELACPVNEKFVGVFPGIGGKDASIIMCAGNDKVFEFYEDVLDEVMDIFPSPYINLGGDEANKKLWEQCRLCRQRIETEGLKDCEELQAYFMDRINHYVRSHGRTAMGWDEVTYGDPKEEMVILGWQGDGSTAVNDSRRCGRKFIMTPAQTTYLIRYQGPQWFEPWTYFGNNTLSDIYNYEPVKADWTPELEGNLLGVQGSLWSEFCKNASDMQYLVFPRLMAVADIGWRSKGVTDWQGFLDAVDRFEPVLDSLGVNHARSMWNIQHKVLPAGDGALNVVLTCERPDAELRYSLGDSTMNQAYADTLTITEPVTVYASTFKNNAKQGQTLVLPLQFSRATGQSVNSPDCRNGLARVLVNGLRGSDRNSDFEWAGWWNGNAEFTVDLGAMQSVKSVRLGTLVNSDICVAAPYRVFLYESADGKEFHLVSDVKTDEKKIWAHPAEVMDIDLNCPELPQTRYLKIVAINPGNVPDGMAREGAATWLYFDELIVE